MNDILYNKLNKKLDTLQHTKSKQIKQHEEYNTGMTTTFYTRIKNIKKRSNITFNREEEKILELGLNYAYERPIKRFLQDLITDTENAIKQSQRCKGNIVIHTATLY
jgi:hypothetical protein